MKRHVPLIVTLLSLACGNEPTAPSSTPMPPAVATFTMRGEVRDTTNLTISGAQVQVVGPSPGTVVVTDGEGRFFLPWPYPGTVTVRVSKEGFHARERPVPEPGSPRRPVFIGFDLEAIDRPIIVAGWYQMTLTAADECTQLPNVVRQRTYRSQVGATAKVGSFRADLFDADFPFGAVLSLEVGGEPLRTLRVHYLGVPDWVNHATTMIERIGPDTFLEVTGSADLPLGAQSAAAAFAGTFAVCQFEAAGSHEIPYPCPVQPATCRSANHRLAWTRQ